MANIKAPIADILNILTAIPGIVHVNIWNKQIGHEAEGKLYDFPKPALFLEAINKPAYAELGQGYKTADVGFRIHLVHEFYDDQLGNFERNLPVFDFAAAVDAAVSFQEPTGCGPLTLKAEGQDYDHTQIYHYVLEFTANFINTTASKYDTGKVVPGPAPTDATISGSYIPAPADPVVLETVAQPSPYRQFNIPQ